MYICTILYIYIYIERERYMYISLSIYIYIYIYMIFLWLEKACHGPQFPGACMKHRGIRFDRIRDFKQYYRCLCKRNIPPEKKNTLGNTDTHVYIYIYIYTMYNVRYTIYNNTIIQ